MTIDVQYPYVHRHNSDGTHDTICLECFRTVSGAINEAELLDAEQIHQCSDLIGCTWCSR
jgi:hypothetical protein